MPAPACYQAASPALARLLREGIVATYGSDLLAAVFGAERRRTKVIPHAFGERAVLKLMHAALIRASERCRGIRVTEFEQRQLNAIRNELDRAHAECTAPAISPDAATTPARLSNKKRT